MLSSSKTIFNGKSSEPAVPNCRITRKQCETIDTIQAFILASIHIQSCTHPEGTSPATAGQVFYNTRRGGSRVVDSARCRSSVAVGRLYVYVV